MVISDGDRLLKIYDDLSTIQSLSTTTKDIFLKELSLPDSTTITLDTFQDLTLEMIAKAKLPLLTAYYKCRMIRRINEKIYIPSKGKLSDVLSGKTDKNSNEKFLIQRVKDVLDKPVIFMGNNEDEESELSLITTQEPIAPPNIVSPSEIVESSKMIDIGSCNSLHDIVYSIDKERMSSYTSNFEGFLEYITTLSTTIKNRMYSYLRDRLPTHRKDLSLSKHWVWKSFLSKLNLLSAMMIGSGHIVDCTALKFRKSADCLLSDRSNFVKVKESSCDGNYIVYDPSRTFIRVGAASVGMNKRWKGHEKASKRSSHTDRKSDFYKAYPSKDAVHQPESDEQKGFFDQLEQLIGVGFEKSNRDFIINLFEWSEEEELELSFLSCKDDNLTMPDKEYKHIVYFF